jgi:hypothetical protein
MKGNFGVIISLLNCFIILCTFTNELHCCHKHFSLDLPPPLHQSQLLKPLLHIAVAIFSFLHPNRSPENYEQTEEALFSIFCLYLIHFSPGFSYDVCGVFGVEGFPEFCHSGFVFTISHQNKFSKCLSEVISLKCSSNSLVYWL